MDVETSIESQLLAHAEKQTKALQSLYLFALIWTLLAAVGAVVCFSVLTQG